MLMPSLIMRTCLLRWKPQASITEMTHFGVHSPTESSSLRLGPRLTGENILKTFYPLIAVLSPKHHPLWQNPIFRGQPGWRSAKQLPTLQQSLTGQLMGRRQALHPAACVLASLPLHSSSLQLHTFAMKSPASMMALMCLNQPEFSSPHRKSLMEGDLSSHTARQIML